MQLVEALKQEEFLSTADDPDCQGGRDGAANFHALHPAPARSSLVAADPLPVLTCKTGGGSIIPFKWEAEPGIPKIRVKEEPISPLHPPPAHHISPSVRSSPRAISNKASNGAAEKPVSPLQSPLARQPSFSAHSSPTSFSTKFKRMISSKVHGQQRSLDVTHNHWQHARREKASNTFLEQVSHLHGYSTYISAGESEDESAYYTPMYSGTPSSYLSVSPKQSDWEASLSNSIQNTTLTSQDGSEIGMLSPDRASSFDNLQNDRNGSVSHIDSAFDELTSQQPPSEVDSQFGNHNLEQGLSPERSQSSASERSLDLKPMLTGRHLSMKFHHQQKHSHYDNFGSFQEKRKLNRSKTMNGYPPCNDSNQSSGNLYSMSSFEFSGRLSSSVTLSEHSGDLSTRADTEISTQETGGQGKTDPQMDLSMFALCRASSMNSTMTRRPLYSYDYSTSMQLLKSVDHASHGLAPMDMDKEISKQFLWLTKDGGAVSRSQRQPLLRKSRTVRLPFRSFFGKLVPCISATTLK
ncbi:hypothetical protein O6H91_12G096200 [Diphasiastrum complanatum]|uniref:Uncharacterized protein n=1 Tax=Diphasiastrum complanatum TaxID=34168 RepID=A0ACC2C514_DIPCM|nr:hypothetical protein O6H91_12G096200 [Diphasiastrum complanatum]